MFLLQSGGTSIQSSRLKNIGFVNTIQPMIGLSERLCRLAMIIRVNSRKVSHPLRLPNVSHATLMATHGGLEKKAMPPIGHNVLLSLNKKGAPGVSTLKPADPPGCQKLTSSGLMRLR